MLKMTFLAASWGHFDHLARKHSKTPRKLEKTEKTGLEATFEVTWSARKHRTCAQIQPRGRFEATSRSLGRSKTLENPEKARKRSKTPRKLDKTETNGSFRSFRGSKTLKNTKKLDKTEKIVSFRSSRPQNARKRCAGVRRRANTLENEPPGTIWWPRHQNAQNEASGSLLGPFGGQGAKMLQMSLLGASWGHLVAKAPKCSK